MNKKMISLLLLILALFCLETNVLARTNTSNVIDEMVKATIYKGETRVKGVQVITINGKVKVDINLIPAADFGSDTYGAGIKQDCYDIFKKIYFKRKWMPKDLWRSEFSYCQIRYLDHKKRIQLTVQMDINQAKSFPWRKYGGYKRIFAYCTINGTEIGKQGIPIK
jgi:hypothetical protein